MEERAVTPQHGSNAISFYGRNSSDFSSVYQPSVRDAHLQLQGTCIYQLPSGLLLKVAFHTEGEGRPLPIFPLEGGAYQLEADQSKDSLSQIFQNLLLIIGCPEIVFFF